MTSSSYIYTKKKPGAITFSLTPLERCPLSPRFICHIVLYIMPRFLLASVYPLFSSVLFASPHPPSFISHLPQLRVKYVLQRFSSLPLPPSPHFPLLHWDLNTRIKSRNGISNKAWFQFEKWSLKFWCYDRFSFMRVPPNRQDNENMNVDVNFQQFLRTRVEVVPPIEEPSMIVFEILRLTFYLGNSRQRIDGELRSKTWFTPATLRCLLNNCLLIFWARNLFNNYSPTLRWIIVLVYSKPVKRQRQKWILSGHYSRARPLCFANQ